VTRLREAVDTLLASPELAAGWWCGLTALAVGLGAAGWWRTRSPTGRPPVAGLLFAGAVGVALGWTVGLPSGLAFGLLGLAGAGAAGRTWSVRWAAAPLAVAGAWLVAFRSGLTLDAGLSLLVAAALVLGSSMLADFDDRWGGRGLGPVLVLVSAVGVYATVPDTEQAMAALGAAIPLAVLGWPWPLATLGRAGAYALAGIILWVVGAGGAGRGSSVVGGVACLGLLAVEPLARRLHPGRRSVLDRLPDGHRGVAVAVVAQAGLVYVAARVAGLRSTVEQAGVIVLVELTAAVVFARLAAGGSSHRSPGRSGRLRCAERRANADRAGP
jgi:hypothetical protein